MLGCALCNVHCPTPNTLPLGCVGFQFLLNLFSQTECDGSGASDTSISGGRPHRPHGTLSASLINWVKLHRRQKQNVVLLNLLRDFKNQIELNCFIKRLQEFETVMILQFWSAILNMVIHGVIHEVRNGVRHGVISIVKSHSSLNSEMAPPLTTRQQGTELPGQLKTIGKRRDQSTSPTQGMTFKRNTFGLLSHVLCVFI